jgi:DNA-binding response OmpR family regulator
MSASDVKHVLVVDDEQLFLRSLSDGLAPLGKRDGFVVRTAANGRDAIAALETEPVDLVVTDLRMPEVDGFQLVSWMVGKKPSVPVVVMTALPSLEASVQLRESGVFTVLQKPVELADVHKTIVAELSAKRARVEGLAVAAFLQLVSMERVTCHLTIRSGERVGRMGIVAGDLVYADFEERDGLAAAHALIGLPDVAIEMLERDDVRQAGLRVPLAEVVLDALRTHDENSRGKGALTAPPAGPSEVDIEFDVMKSVRPQPLPEIEAPVIAIENKETKMNVISVEKANAAVNKLRESLGAALVATDVWSVDDGMPIAGFNSQPVATALFNRITDMITETLSESGFPSLNKYYLLDLEGDKSVVILPLGKYRAGMLVDKKKAQLGVVVSVALPKFVAGLEEAIRG